MNTSKETRKDISAKNTAQKSSVKQALDDEVLEAVSGGLGYISSGNDKETFQNLFNKMNNKI